MQRKRRTFGDESRLQPQAQSPSIPTISKQIPWWHLAQTSAQGTWSVGTASAPFQKYAPYLGVLVGATLSWLGNCGVSTRNLSFK